MKINEEGRACCDNCGSAKWVAPQIRENAEGDQDVLLCCGNCGHPSYTGLTVPKADDEMLEALQSFFDHPQPGQIIAESPSE
jgi:uncharacterized Zn finger protein